MVLSAVGGFPEVAADGAARVVPPGDATALGAVLAELLGDEEARRELGTSAELAAARRYSWDSIAAQTLALYGELLG
jgi:glycosyltransferase involved in cell wall biosynthesis